MDGTVGLLGGNQPIRSSPPQLALGAHDHLLFGDGGLHVDLITIVRSKPVYGRLLHVFLVQSSTRHTVSLVRLPCGLVTLLEFPGSLTTSRFLKFLYDVW